MPIKLELENFMSHSKSILDFNFNSALISGENGAGKSTILEAIGFCLFGKSRQKAAADVVKRGASQCKVTFQFKHDDKIYRIMRSKHAKYGSLDDVSFYELMQDGSERQIQGDTNTEINEKIKQIIRSNYDVFSNTSYFMQNTFFEFMNGTSSSRQKLVSSLLNLERWDEYMEEANAKLKDVTKELDVLNLRLDDFKNTELDIELAEKKLQDASAKLKEYVSNEEVLKQTVQALEIKIANMATKDMALASYHEAKSKLDTLTTKLGQIKSQLVEKEKLATSLAQDIATGTAQMADIDAQISGLSEILALKGSYDIEDMEKKLIKGKTKFDILSSQIHNIKHNDICQACDSVIGDEHVKHSKLEAKNAELSDLSEKIARAQAILDKTRATDARIKKAELEVEKYITRKRKIETSNETSEIKRQSACNEIDLLKKSQLDIEEQLVAINKVISQIQAITESESMDVIKDQLVKRKRELAYVSSEKDAAISDVGSTKQKLEQLKKDLVKKKEFLAKQTDVKKTVYVYSSLVKAFSRNGIQAIIIDNVIEELAKVTNDYLNEFSSTPMYVNFITQKKDTKGSWKETLDLEIVTPSGLSSFESLSGGERFRVTFAIRLALNVLQARRMGGETQLLLLDEVSSSLDKSGLEIFASIIKKLEKSMKILVITHDDNLKDVFDNIVLVSKVGHDSFISQ